jgi:hypothetical protein
MASNALGVLGALLTLIGSIMIAISVGKNLEEAHQIDDKGRKVYLATINHPSLFPWGITVLIIGFSFLFAQNIVLLNNINSNQNRFDFIQRIDAGNSMFTVFDRSNGNISVRLMTGEKTARLAFHLNNSGLITKSTQEVD